LWIKKYKVAYIHAGGIPIAVPLRWRKNVSPILKTLFLMTREIAEMIALLSGRSLTSGCELKKVEN
jgi:hypothetical protein